MKKFWLFRVKMRKDRQHFCKSEKIANFEHAKAKRPQILGEKWGSFAPHIPTTQIYVSAPLPGLKLLLSESDLLFSTYGSGR